MSTVAMLSAGVLTSGMLASPARGVIECAITPSDPGIMENTITGTLSEADAWDTVVIGTVIRVIPTRDDGYRRVDLRPEAVFRGDTTSVVPFYYPLIDEDDGLHFEVGGRYFVTAGHDNPRAPGLEASRCSATQQIDSARAMELIALGDPLIVNPIPAPPALFAWIPIAVVAGVALAIPLMLVRGRFVRRRTA
jgi:hypothetical protein